MKDTGDIAKELLERLPKPNIYILQLLKKTEENEKLKKENEKLKQEIERWKKRCAEIYWDS